MRKLENKIKYVLVMAFFATFAFSNNSLAQVGDISAAEVIKLLNQERQEKNLSILSENVQLNRAAKMKAEDMIKNDYFAHNSPQGKTPWHWFEKSGYEYKFAGENLAVNYSNAGEQHEAWMKSPSHRDNILKANYREVGVAVLEGKIDGEKSILTVQLFGTPIIATINPQKTVPTISEPAPVPEVKSAQSVTLPETLVPVENVPVEKAPEVVPVQAYVPAEIPVVSSSRAISIIWSSAFSLFFLAILLNSLVGVGKGYEIILEAFHKKETSQKILVRYEGFIESIKINMQRAGASHSVRGRPG